MRSELVRRCALVAEALTVENYRSLGEPEGETPMEFIEGVRTWEEGSALTSQEVWAVVFLSCVDRELGIPVRVWSAIREGVAQGVDDAELVLVTEWEDAAS